MNRSTQYSLPLIASIFWHFGLHAQSVCDDFESYSLGRLDSQSVIWDAWPTSLGVQDTEVSDDQHYSGNRSMRVHGQGPNSWSDIYSNFGSIDSGIWRLDYQVFVPTNGGGRMASLSFFNSGSPESSVFMHLFNLNGNTAKGKIYNVNAANLDLLLQFDITLNIWFELSMVVDLDLKKVKYYKDSVLLYSGDWRSGDGIMQNQLNAFNIWSQNEAIGFTPDIYVDDFCLQPSPWNVGEEEVLMNDLRLYPQPCDHSLYVEGAGLKGDRIVVLDVQGRMVIQEQIRSESRHMIDTSQLRPGIYILETKGARRTFIVR